MSDEKKLALDDLTEMLAKQGHPLAMVMLKARREIREGTMTPERIRELARGAVPDLLLKRQGALL
jgi:hypothetical protein